MTDRITGIILLVFALLYGFGALRLKAGFGSGPVGPKGFPIMLAIVLAIVAVGIFLRTDPEPSWLKRGAWVNIGAASISFIIYAYLLVPIGFIISTTLVTGFISERFGANWWRALLTGFASSLALYALFVFALDIPLPIGRVFGGR